MMAVLCYLAEHAGESISRDQLVADVWQRRAVSDQAINRIIARLRKALGDGVADRDYIETIPKYGYRLIAPVEAQAVEAETPAAGVTPPQQRQQPLLLLVALIGLLAWLIYRGFTAPEGGSGEQPPDVREVRRVTVQLGNERSPEFSPDGRYLAYEHRSPDSDYWQIMVTDQETSRTIALTDSAHENREPRWSPTGDWLAFHRYGEALCQILKVDLRDGLSTMPIADKISDCDPSSTRLSLDWSADERYLYYTDAPATVSPYAIYRLDLTTGERLLLTDPPAGGRGDYVIDVTADGSRMVVLRNQRWSDTEILIQDLVSGEQRLIQSLPEVLLDVAWSQDEQHLLLGKVNGRIEQLAVADGVMQPIYLSPDPVFSPTTRPQMDRIAFVLGNTDVTNIRQVTFASADNPASSQVLIESSRQDTLPTYANNSRQMVFLSDRSGEPQIWHRGESGGLQQITQLDEVPNIVRIHWSPDDGRILYESKGGIYAVDFASRSNARLTAEKRPAFNPVWSADGSAIFYASEMSGEWQLWRLQLSDRTHAPVTRNGGFCAAAEESGEYLYLIKYNEPGIWQFNLSNGNERLLVADIPVSLCDALSVRQHKLYYSMRTDTRPVMVWDPQSGQSQLLLERSAASRYHFSVSSNGDLLAYATRMRAESAIAILRYDER
ncbi:MAG: hypothetical protein Tsb002_09500 [Wenzhouxiangellaceae bacterium]